jgi:uncharacterized protein
MNRLDESQTLNRAIVEGKLRRRQLDRVIATLVDFYHHAGTALISPVAYISEFGWNSTYDRRLLLDPRFRLPVGTVRHIERTQRRFLSERSNLFAQRVRDRHIVDGHGDLRPEHIFLGDPVRIIDCLEFNARLRMVDQLDEIAFLCIECERLGAAWAGAYLRQRISRGLGDGHLEALFIFYRCYRATLRARLAVAHLLDAVPRTPEKWLPLARSYLRLAAVDAKKLERSLKKPASHQGYHRHAVDGRLRPGAGLREGCRVSGARRSSRADMSEPNR